MTQTILALDAGSRSHAARLYAVGDPVPEEPPAPLWQAEDESRERGFADLLAGYRGEPPAAVGHRVVHPGLRYVGPTDARVDDALRERIEAAAEFAPLHNRISLEGIDATRRRFPETPQFAVFDTALTAEADAAARTYPLRAERRAEGFVRLGFHGISIRDAVPRALRLAGAGPEARTVCVHLGNGCSVAGARGEAILSSTMGFTPLEGPAMGTRSGSIDLGVVFALLRRGVSAEALERELNHDAGLRALSDGSPDTRDLLPAATRGDANAALALDVYVRGLQRAIGATLATLGGCELLVFTGPVGEHAAEIRRRVCAPLGFAGVALDPERNAAAVRDRDEEIGVPANAVRVFSIRTLEAWAVAYRTARALAAA